MFHHLRVFGQHQRVSAVFESAGITSCGVRSLFLRCGLGGGRCKGCDLWHCGVYFFGVLWDFSRVCSILLCFRCDANRHISAHLRTFRGVFESPCVVFVSLKCGFVCLCQQGRCILRVCGNITYRNNFRNKMHHF